LVHVSERSTARRCLDRDPRRELVDPVGTRLGDQVSGSVKRLERPAFDQHSLLDDGSVRGVCRPIPSGYRSNAPTFHRGEP